MPSDSNEYISFTSSQCAEDNQASLQDTYVDEIDEAAERLKCGCVVCNMWGWFTDDRVPQKLKCVICKHCQQSMYHHRKSKSAKNHMNKCSNFCTAMNGMEQEDWPNWHIPNKKGGKK